MNTKVWQDASVPSLEEATGDAILGETQAISSETGELKLRKTQTEMPSLIQMHCLQRSLFMLFFFAWVDWQWGDRLTHERGSSKCRNWGLNEWKVGHNCEMMG